MSKLILDETDDRLLLEDLDNMDQLSMSNLISSMIKGEWDAIELYNTILATITQDTYKFKSDVADAVEVINDIVKEEYVHIGQLEKLLQTKIPASTSIEDGKMEAAVETQQVVPVAQVQPSLQDAVVVQPAVEVEESISQDVSREEERLIDRFGPEVMDYIDEYIEEKNMLSDNEKLNYVGKADRERYANPQNDWERTLDDSKIWSYLWYSPEGWSQFADWARQRYNVDIR